MIDASPPRPALTIDNRAPGQFVLQANAAIEVAASAVIERRADDGQWSPYHDLEEGKGFGLLEACGSSDMPPCRALHAGDTLVLVPWSGYSCAAQCNDDCDKNVFRPGAHRLVVTACDAGKTRYEGAPFEIPASASTLSRYRAASDIVRVTAARLDPRRPKEASDAGDENHRAGFAVLPDTDKPMEVDGRAELAKWLRNKEGFKEVALNVKKACTGQPLVGFSLVSSAAPDRERTTEIAVEFACNRITLVEDQAGRRHTTVSSFEPSRSVIVGIASRALPTDDELRRLQ